MRGKIAIVMFAAMAASLALAETSDTSTKAKEDGKALVETFTKIENEWARADKELDAKALGQLLADDWFFLGPQGTETKSEHLAGLKKGVDNISSIDLLDMQVRLYGNIAVV